MASNCDEGVAETWDRDPEWAFGGTTTGDANNSGSGAQWGRARIKGGGVSWSKKTTWLSLRGGEIGRGTHALSVRFVTTGFFSGRGESVSIIFLLNK